MVFILYYLDDRMFLLFLATVSQTLKFFHCLHMVVFLGPDNEPIQLLTIMNLTWIISGFARNVLCQSYVLELYLVQLVKVL